MLPSIKSKIISALLYAILLLSANKYHNFHHVSSAAGQPAFFVHHSHRPNTKIERCQPLQGIKGFRSWFESAFPSSVEKVQHPSPVRRAPRKGASKNNIHKSKSNKKSQQIIETTPPEVYDHVLIDANQFLHSNLRKAFNRKLKRSKGNATIIDGQSLDEDFIEYSLLLLIQDLNRLTSTVAIPRKSLVIAIDGSPGAAKLEMQRRRRFGLYKKVELQQKLLEVLRERGWNDAHFGFFNNKDKKAKNKHITLLAKHEREKVTMNITPGTAYLDRVTDALLYWSWRQVANPFWPPSPDPNNKRRGSWTKIYISPSMVPGEGEVKLLDFMLRGQDGKGRKTIHSDDSVAFIGGDSDLVLMGLATNPSVTQNVHVILPGENSKTLMISVWETTRHLVGMLEGTAAYGKRPTYGKGKTKARRKLSKKEIQQVRLDAVLLVILNGNDYLPKLRYSSTFDSFFEVYLDLMTQTLANRDENDRGETLKPFLLDIDNDEININVPFAIAFFREMAARYYSGRLPKSGETLPAASSSLQTELGILNNLVEARFIPGPIHFQTVSANQESMYQSLLDEDLDTVFDDDVEIMRMTIGNFPEDFNTNEIESTIIGESDGHGVISRMIKSKTNDRSYLFEVPHKQGFPNKSTKLRLACLALEEIFGKENLSLLFGSQHDDEDDDDDNVERQLAPAEPVLYLGGLLWTLETYRRGKCADFGYNYGRKSAPSALELVSLLEQHEHGQKLSRFDLLGDSDVAPLSDGMSCLAALPPQAHTILEEPYSWLVEPSSRANFEEIYDSCFSDGVFDSQSFAEKCSKQINNMRSERSISKADTKRRKTSSSQRGRHIQSSSKYWTVLSLSKVPLEHPFAPPEPISERTPRLKTSKRVRASKLPVSHALPPPIL